MACPDFSLEEHARASGAMRVAGVDEVGRGPLAGPVTAAAVVLDSRRIPCGLNDSKKLSPKVRAELYGAISDSAEIHVAHASVEEIDRLNILRATHLAMARALWGLRSPPCLALIDGNSLPRGLGVDAQAVIKGDARSLSIAAASIVAKHVRDCMMRELAGTFPGYGWETNAGYGSRRHIEALRELGPTALHRHSFAPVAEAARRR